MSLDASTYFEHLRAYVNDRYVIHDRRRRIQVVLSVTKRVPNDSHACQDSQDTPAIARAGDRVQSRL